MSFGQRYSVARGGKWVYYNGFFDSDHRKQNNGSSLCGATYDSTFGPMDSLGMTPKEASYPLPPICVRDGSGASPEGKIAKSPSPVRTIAKAAGFVGVAGLLHAVVKKKG